MSDLELGVVGAGPQALALLSYLAEYRPETLQRTVVFDTEDWLARWHRQFAACRIAMLRSAIVHHPHPHPYALMDYAHRHGRSAEFSGPIGRPGTELFADFCDDLLDSLQLRGLRLSARAGSGPLRWIRGRDQDDGGHVDRRPGEAERDGSDRGGACCRDRRLVHSRAERVISPVCWGWPQRLQPEDRVMLPQLNKPAFSWSRPSSSMRASARHSSPPTRARRCAVRSGS